MRDKNLFFRLNTVHITHLGFIFVLLSSAICLFYFSSVKSQELKDLQDFCKKNNSKIEGYFNLFENHTITPSSKIELKENFLFDKDLNQSDKQNERSLIVFDENIKVLSYSFNSKILSETNFSYFEEWAAISSNSSDSNKLRYEKFLLGNDKFHTYTINNENHKLIIVVFQPVKSIYKSIAPYTKIILICFFSAFLLTILLIVLTNFKLTHSFSELVISLKSSNILKMSISEKDNETEIIRKYIGILENQIIFYEKKNEKISNSNSSLENDLKLAKKLQKNMLQSISPTDTSHNDFELYAFSEPAFEVGGDLYDYFHVDEEHLFITVADVAGKGIPASLYMIFTLTLLRSISKPGLTVTDIIKKLNNKLIDENISDMFVTIFMGILNTKTGEFNYCNAAHSFPCLITVNGDVSELSESHGIPIGIYPDRTYQSSTIFLNDGDQVFIYTDGLTDTIDENGLKFSVDVLKYNLMGTWFFSAGKVVEKIKTSVENFRGKSHPVDDLTILNLKYTPKKDN